MGGWLASPSEAWTRRPGGSTGPRQHARARSWGRISLACWRTGATTRTKSGQTRLATYPYRWFSQIDNGCSYSSSNAPVYFQGSQLSPMITAAVVGTPDWTKFTVSVPVTVPYTLMVLSLIHISEPTRLGMI